MNDTRLALKKTLASPETSELRLGYVRLTDSAPLIIAQELGYYAEYGLDVTLERQSSWANVRDKIAAGYLDAAQMLAPMLLTTTLGLGGMRTPLLTGLSLSSNGNAITLSKELASQVAEQTVSPVSREAARSAAQRLGTLIKERSMLTLATVHPFSTHSLQLRMWLRAGGIDPDKDLRIIVLPPEQMVDSLSRGIIDGFCVGEPWNTRAVQYGVGSIITTGYQVWNNAPEKKLGVTQSWHAKNSATHLRLRLALMKAAEWLDVLENRPTAARILSKPEYLDLPQKELLPSLSGEISFAREQNPNKVSRFHQFSAQNTGFPWRSHATLILQHVEYQIGRKIPEDQKKSLIQECYRTDLYREAARELNIPSPDQDTKEENTHKDSWVSDQGLKIGADLLLD